MSTAGIALFLAGGLVALLSAIGTVLVKSPIRAAMCLLAHIVALSGLFLSLHAHLLAALQLLVYAGAVVVLFVFVIMLMGPAVPETRTTRGLVTKTISASLMGIAMLAVSSVLLSAGTLERPLISGCTPEQGAECGQFGGVSAFSQHLFGTAPVPFELVSILLTIAIVGAIAVARGRSAAEVEAIRKLQAERAEAEAAQRAREEALSAEVAAHGGH
jgi:NADH-quinone oxidoreductase subunit J